jgi:UPF0122 protein CLI_2506
MNKKGVKYISITNKGVVKVEKNVKISMLLDIYGNLLTEKQNELLDDYYNNDLSLSEIAENQLITRQAVRDNLKKGENKLFEYEEKLGFMKKTIMHEEQVAKILSELNKIEKKSTDKEVAKVLQDVRKKINCLI